MSLPATLESDRRALHDEALAFASASKSKGTLATYLNGWKDFETFCQTHHVASLPAIPATVVAYLTHLAREQRPSTIQVKLSAIEHYHIIAHLDVPTNGPEVAAVMAGIRRTLGMAVVKKAPVMLDDLRLMVAAIPDSLAGIRDRAIILVGFAGAFRRSELADLDLRDIEVGRQLKLRLRRSKTDQRGEGTVKVIPALEDRTVCALTALKAWLEQSAIEDGPVFRPIDKWGKVGRKRLSGKAIAQVVKTAVTRIGLDADLFAGHSLRSGFITEAAIGGAEQWEIMEQSKHISEKTMRAYIQDAGVGATEAVRAAFREK